MLIAAHMAMMEIEGAQFAPPGAAAPGPAAGPRPGRAFRSETPWLINQSAGVSLRSFRPQACSRGTWARAAGAAH